MVVRRVKLKTLGVRQVWPRSVGGGGRLRRWYGNDAPLDANYSFTTAIFGVWLSYRMHDV